MAMTELEKYFEQFRKNIVGNDAKFESPFGEQKMIYADWIASGRLYTTIENKIKDVYGPMVGNTHSEASETGRTMTHAYHLAHEIIKKHVNASKDDVIITAGFGMTAVINKFQRILGLKVTERSQQYCLVPNGEKTYCNNLPEQERPVVFITHMEHHSNHTSWIETIADVVVIEPDDNLLVDPENLRKEIVKYKNRKLKIGAFSAASNVTGIIPPYYELAKVMHEHGGVCFVDFAASAPYSEIDMHPTDDPMKSLDAIFFSPHKFLGGPGSSGVLIFNSNLYNSKVPDHPGGGTVLWTNRWNKYSFVDDIETREDGGTPGFLQAIRSALVIKLKEKMDCKKMEEREKELLQIVFDKLRKIPKLRFWQIMLRKDLGLYPFMLKIFILT